MSELLIRLRRPVELLIAGLTTLIVGCSGTLMVKESSLQQTPSRGMSTVTARQVVNESFAKGMVRTEACGPPLSIINAPPTHPAAQGASDDTTVKPAVAK